MVVSPLTAPPIRRAPNNFVDFTVTKRLPKIAATALTALSGVAASGAQRAVEQLVERIVAGAPIDTQQLERATPFWSDYIDGSLVNTTWARLPFFDLEFVFYHALNSIAGYFSGGTDVFRSTRGDALRSAIEGLAAAERLPGDNGIADALWFALLGNEADYSQLAVDQRASSKWSDALLIDERPELLARLDGPANQHAAIHLIADNAGPELLADLILVDALLTANPHARLVVHCKPWPMFVSDAIAADVHDTCSALRAQSAPLLADLGDRLQAALASARLTLEEHTAWGEPRHFDNLPSELSASLQRSHAVIAKGDLNYRRFVGDRAWPSGASAREGSRGVPFVGYSLRILKSDALVGVTEAQVKRASARNPAWRTDGTHAVVQRLGGFESGGSERTGDR